MFFSELPDVDEFWSVTMYGMDFNLVSNPIDRFAIRDRTPGLVYDDGRLTLHIGHDQPTDPAERANWLPAPAGEFYLVLRCYIPGPAIIDQTWQPPAVTPAG